MTLQRALVAIAVGLVCALGLLKVIDTPVASAHLDGLVHVKPYEWMNCGEPAGDPISVVFYNNATAANVHTHAAHHRSWNDTSDPDPVLFYNHGCQQEDGSDANGAVYQSRFHMRHVWNYDPTEAWLGYYSTATPHKENVNWFCGGNIVNHKVISTSGSEPGGFVRGKWEIGYGWHNWNNGGGAHYFLESQFWDNQLMIPQCEGQAKNDGWVDFVKIN